MPNREWSRLTPTQAAAVERCIANGPPSAWPPKRGDRGRRGLRLFAQGGSHSLGLERPAERRARLCPALNEARRAAAGTRTRLLSISNNFGEVEMLQTSISEPARAGQWSRLDRYTHRTPEKALGRGPSGERHCRSARRGHAQRRHRQGAPAGPRRPQNHLAPARAAPPFSAPQWIGPRRAAPGARSLCAPRLPAAARPSPARGGADAVSQADPHGPMPLAYRRSQRGRFRLLRVPEGARPPLLRAPRGHCVQPGRPP